MPRRSRQPRTRIRATNRSGAVTADSGTAGATRISWPLERDLPCRSDCSSCWGSASDAALRLDANSGRNKRAKTRANRASRGPTLAETMGGDSPPVSSLFAPRCTFRRRFLPRPQVEGNPLWRWKPRMKRAAVAHVSQQEVLTAPEAARLLRIGRDSLYAAANRGEIPHRRLGRRMIFSRSALLRWLAVSEVDVANDAQPSRAVRRPGAGRTLRRVGPSPSASPRRADTSEENHVSTA